jgi:hypothetical protein
MRRPGPPRQRPRVGTPTPEFPKGAGRATEAALPLLSEIQEIECRKPLLVPEVRGTVLSSDAIVLNFRKGAERVAGGRRGAGSARRGRD